MSAFSSQLSPKDFAYKSPKGFSRGFTQQFTPQQMQLFSQLFGQVGPESFLGKIAGGDQGAFEQMEAPAWRDLSRAQGQMASRFSGMGMGAQKSSGFKNSMGQLGSDFAQDLQSKRMAYRQQAINDLMGLSQNLLNQRPYEQFFSEKPQGGFQKFMNFSSPIASALAGGFMGGR
jgi:hypothetical protein